MQYGDSYLTRKIKKFYVEDPRRCFVKVMSKKEFLCIFSAVARQNCGYPGSHVYFYDFVQLVIRNSSVGSGWSLFSLNRTTHICHRFTGDITTQQCMRLHDNCRKRCPVEGHH